MSAIDSRVRPLRLRRGLSQAELAVRAAISRQSLSAIEQGRVVPSTEIALAMSDALGCRVEDLFSLRRKAIPVEVVAGARSSRVVLAMIGGRWVAHPVTSAPADGVLLRAGKARLLSGQGELRERLLIAGCAPGLGILASHVPGARWIDVSSAEALRMVSRNQVHIAGAHLLDDASGDFNVSFAKRALGSRRGKIYTLGRWEMGLVVASGNPKHLRRAADLARQQVKVVNRPDGSGAAALLSRWLGAAGVPALAVKRIPALARTHAEIAAAVKFGAADAGIAIRSVAEGDALSFVPVVEERFDLVVPAEHRDHPGVQRLLEILPARAFRDELAALPGHSVRESGRMVAELEG